MAAPQTTVYDLTGTQLNLLSCSMNAHNYLPLTVEFSIYGPAPVGFYGSLIKVIDPYFGTLTAGVIELIGEYDHNADMPLIHAKAHVLGPNETLSPALPATGTSLDLLGLEVAFLIPQTMQAPMTEALIDLPYPPQGTLRLKVSKVVPTVKTEPFWQVTAAIVQKNAGEYPMYTIKQSEEETLQSLARGMLEPLGYKVSLTREPDLWLKYGAGYLIKLTHPLRLGPKARTIMADAYWTGEIPLHDYLSHLKDKLDHGIPKALEMILKHPDKDISIDTGSPLP